MTARTKHKYTTPLSRVLHTYLKAHRPKPEDIAGDPEWGQTYHLIQVKPNETKKAPVGSYLLKFKPSTIDKETIVTATQYPTAEHAKTAFGWQKERFMLWLERVYPLV